MVEKKVLVLNEYGLHARPSAALVKTAANYESEIYLIKDDITANAKSIISVMSLAAEPESELTIRTEGADEQSALDGICDLFNNRFNLGNESE